MNSFFRILVDPSAINKWHLKAPIDNYGKEVDPRDFTKGVRSHQQGALRLPVRRPGDPLDFNFADFDMIVAREELGETLTRELDVEIERVPVFVGDGEGYEIWNPLERIACFDENKSTFSRWNADDNRSQKTGSLRQVTNLHIYSHQVRGRHLFRIDEWPVALICSAAAKDVLTRLETTGIVFANV